jgi:hypothetical protein
MKAVLLIGLGLGAAAAVLAGCQTSRSHYESAPYRTLRKEGSFELRSYPALNLVETAAAGPKASRNNGFRRLFRFIAGQNEAAIKIPMTTPVFLSGQPEERAMAFVMPIDRRPEEIPRPTDPAVSLRRMPGGLFAVRRFSGFGTASNEAAQLKKLRGWIQKQGLLSYGEPVIGYFDPPWTLPFLRRNEVMLPIDQNGRPPGS